MNNPSRRDQDGTATGIGIGARRSRRGRSRVNDKTLARMSSRKTSSFSLARATATQLAGVQAQATLYASSAGHTRACDVGPADSWYWKHGPGGTYLCCSSGGDEACTHLF